MYTRTSAPSFSSLPFWRGRGGVPVYVLPRRAGLGAVTGQSIAGMAQAGADTTAAILVSLGVIAGPIGAAIASVAALGVAIASQFRGCGQTCVAASNIANQVGDILTQNVHAYVSSPIRTVSMQAAALNNYDTAWAALMQACGNPQLGPAGVACIQDRQSGACAYKTSPGGWVQAGDGSWSFTWPGANGSGSACWNWVIGMRDPIANDPDVRPDSALTAAVQSAGGSLTSGGFVVGATTAPAALPGWLALAGLGAAVVFLL